MIAIKEFFNDVEQINEMVLAEKSDELWKIGSLAEIKTLCTACLCESNRKLERRRMVVYLL